MRAFQVLTELPETLLSAPLAVTFGVSYLYSLVLRFGEPLFNMFHSIREYGYS